jgi:hypothetical protein
MPCTVKDSVVNCAERKDLILLYCVRSAEPAEEASLTAHLRDGCPRCVGEIAAARTMARPRRPRRSPVAPSPAVKERLFKQIAGSKVVPFHGGRPAASENSPRRWPAAAVAALSGGERGGDHDTDSRATGDRRAARKLASARDSVRRSKPGRHGGGHASLDGLARDPNDRA